MKNILGRPGLNNPYMGAFSNYKPKDYKILKAETKPEFYDDLDHVLDKLDLKDGLTISFHHHLRNGDYVLNLVMDKIHKMGIKDIKIAASAIFPCHEPLVKMMEDGTVTKIYASYYSGPVAKAISFGKCKDICVISTHGGRPRSILEGDLNIDIAFIASPAMDKIGNISGSGGPSSCGVLGYAYPDAQAAKKVVAITDFITDELQKIEIAHYLVDYVVKIDKIGDSDGIVSGTTKITKDPVGLKIARDCAKIIECSGLLKDGFSFQTGAGGISLAVAKEVKDLMIKNDIKGSFASGGINSYMVDMLEEDLFDELYDVQCFDLAAVESIAKNDRHNKMSSNQYANINNPESICSKLDIVILGASEIDLNYNVNVSTGSDGIILGGSGGHADTAAGAKLSIIVSKLVNARISCITDEVITVTTPGETIDILVTERGVAINPKHSELIDKLKEKTNLDIMPIEDLKKIADEMTGIPKKFNKSNDIVAISEYRDGTILDLIYKVEE
ncbi:MAG: citrate lyase subunit alpha [Tissierellia bacterium]|nr:citrate lyase subunit alpha [Tissierellia bacterium]